MWWIVMIVLIAVASGSGSDYMKHKRKMEQIRVDVLNKEIELEQIRQENYLLENQSMMEELHKIRAENRLSYERDENRRWLIEETKIKEN
ncbi:hypothetical protein ACFOLA_04625 [Salinicoccus hispanicus]|uniref:Uncharacterized protein n=1 Tax=Salinicoccus hispanicus TaxID=157225 RepID=A0A6N8U6Y0_9STAP|nr:hypothetical protein [Salinicoccus hispanicus]MXQ52101.1 hypothetical protein [Salinicoccus hispanicus]